MKRWTNWVADFGARISALKTMKEEAKKEFLDGVVSTITAKTVEENRFECTVHFRLPYVEDSLVEATGAGVKFRVKKGKDRITVPLVFTAVKRRRRKQSLRELAPPSLIQEN